VEEFTSSTSFNLFYSSLSSFSLPSAPAPSSSAGPFHHSLMFFQKMAARTPTINRPPPM